MLFWLSVFFVWHTLYVSDGLFSVAIVFYIYFSIKVWVKIQTDFIISPFSEHCMFSLLIYNIPKYTCKGNKKDTNKNICKSIYS